MCVCSCCAVDVIVVSCVSAVAVLCMSLLHCVCTDAVVCPSVCMLCVQMLWCVCMLCVQLLWCICQPACCVYRCCGAYVNLGSGDSSVVRAPDL